jgi:hypothetical protein
MRLHLSDDLLLARIDLEIRIIKLIHARLRILDRLVAEAMELIGVGRGECYGRIDFLVNRGCILMSRPVGPSGLITVSLSQYVPDDDDRLFEYLYLLRHPHLDIALP